MKKRGLSTVVATLILVLLAVVLVGVVWSFLSGFINKEIKTAESCFKNFNSATIEGDYTCYNPFSQELEFSININDVKIDEILISITGKGESKSFELSNTNSVIPYVKMHNGNYSDGVILPSKNAGLTYVVNMTYLGIGNPTKIKIAPVINGKQCEITDSLSEFYDCRLMT